MKGHLSYVRNSDWKTYEQEVFKQLTFMRSRSTFNENYFVLQFFYVPYILKRELRFLFFYWVLNLRKEHSWSVFLLRDTELKGAVFTTRIRRNLKTQLSFCESTLIRHENGAYRKRSSNQRTWKTSVSLFSAHFLASRGSFLVFSFSR